MADLKNAERNVEDAATDVASAKTFTPPTMMSAATQHLGAGALSRKLARRIARKAEGRLALSPMADSFSSSSGSAAQMAADHTPAQQASATDVASAGFSGASHEVPHRKEMESSFGADFSGVKAYSDGNASAANHSLNSHAYAMGDQVAFRSASPDKATVAHELTHVLQQTQSPSYKSEDGGIDTSGEHEAEAVEAAVASGRPASSALSTVRPASGGAALKSVSGVAPARKGMRPALEGAGGGSKFGMGMTFSLEGFEKSYDYTIWKGHYAWPIGIPGVNFVIDPNVKVSGKGQAKYAGKEAGNLSAQLGVFGEVGIGLSGGIPDVAEIYGTFNPSVEGSFTFTKEAEHAHAAGEHPAAGGEHAPEGGAAKPKESSWNLAGAITVKGAAKVGVSLAGGIIDQAFELGSIDICKFTGVYFDANGFRGDKIGFEWGPKIKAAWEGLKTAIDKAKNMGKAGIQAAKDAGHAIAKKASSIGHWVSSWF